LLITCGALAAHVREIVHRRGWAVEITVLSATLHNRPSRIPAAVEALAAPERGAGRPVVVVYADCGTYGVLDEVCTRLGISHLRGLHCYDIYASPPSVRRLAAEEPGTYLLTDFLVRSFDRLVLHELGIDRHPELWADYFGNYRRVVWLAQDRSPETEARARSVAARFGLPLVIIETGTSRLEQELERALGPAAGVSHGSGPDSLVIGVEQGGRAGDGHCDRVALG
jgi:Protein of unknown function (DUF1638)